MCATERNTYARAVDRATVACTHVQCERAQVRSTLHSGRPQTEPEIGNRTGISENRTGYGLQRNRRNRNRRNRNRGLQKVVPLHRPEVGQIKSCRGLSTTIRKLSARSTKWTWFGFPRGLAEARFLFFWFFQCPALNQFQKKQEIQARPSLEFRISRLQENARIQKHWKTIKKKEEKRKRKRERGGPRGPGAPRAPGPPSLFFSLSFPLFF